ncbi:hypothetical protein P879_01813 [Paragonimus westermani]|uniref:Protocadherin Fat 1/2/3 n=1 Tax=Paragonimus westermani TaxID=34504 RepID=A0A8T0DLN2_9TREM|nr:hypothetical protein P879_01813 [Paragonimus westermani]
MPTYWCLSFFTFEQIHPKSGRIRLLRGLDRETQSAYELVIEAVGQTRQKYNHPRTPSLHYLRLVRLAEANNRAHLGRSALTRLLITVMDVNDNVPVFIPPGLPEDSGAHTHLLPTTTYDINGYNLFIPEDMPEGAFLTTLTASDADDGVNGLVGYSLFGNPKDIECFRVEELTGVIRLTAGCVLSKLRGKSIRLAAWAFDHGTPQLTTNTSLTIHVIAVHLNVFPPTFQMQPALYSGWIAENQDIGSPVVETVDKVTPLKLHATDPEGAPLSFVVSGGSGMGYFYVDDHGFIRTRRVLDAESLSDEGGYWLTVYAIEGPSEFLVAMNNDLLSKAISSEFNGPMRTLAEVFIEVADENDNYPIPLSPEFNVELAENSPPDVLVATVPATDPDRNTSSLQYRISAGDPQGHFTISTESGSIRTTARPLDREAVLKETGANQLILVVSISDRDSPQKSCQVHILITLLDENDQTPKFISLGVFDSSLLGRAEVPIYHFRVYESEQDKSGCVGRVIATDLDDSLNGSVFYWRDTVSNVAADVVYPDGGFDVLSDSGLICTETGPLEAGEYRIRVFAKDRGQPARIANENRPVAVHISILRGGRSFSPGTQRDRHSLQFTYVPPKTHTLQDNLPCGHQLFTFAVSDSLDPSGLSVTYSLTIFAMLVQSSCGDAPWILHELQTRVSVTPFDNRRPVFSPEKFSKDAVARIDVTDLSEASHILGAAGYQVQASLNESVLVGSLVCRLEAYVPMISGEPVSPLEYSVFTVGQDVTRQAFNLNTQTGELRVAQPLDHETISQHYLLISVRRMNNPSLSTFINVFVNVSNTNEHAPQFLTVASSSGSAADHLQSVGFTFFVNGISPVGTVVGRVTAVDPDSGDNGRIRYSIVGEDATAYFEIDSVTGDLRISKPLLLGLSRDPSGDSFHLRWVHEHRVIVAATDNGRPVSRSNHTVVLVQIIPGPGGIDAPAPRFRTTGTVHFTVAENTPPDYVITSLSQLLTMDSVAYGFLHFDLISAYAVDLLADHNTAVMGIQQPQSVANLELFHVTTNTGLLVTLVHLDRERHGDLHRLVVRVKGSSGIRAEISDYLMLEIHIIDVNDNTPTISTPRFIRGYVSEDAPPGSLVTQQCVLNDILDACAHSSAIPVQIIATDPDLGLNGQIVYQLMSASAQESARLFNLDSTNGLLRVSPDVQLDRETASHHSLFVQVSDSGSPARTADNLIRIEIEVLDVNDSPPVFDETFYMRTLMLPTYPSELIVQLSATDPDMNDTVSYRFSDQLSANYFTLDALTGRLRVAPNSSLLNHNLPMPERNFLVMVEAYDCHKPKPHVARINVTVFTQLSSPSAGDSTPLIIDPEGGLDVNLVEHYAGHEPLRLGQLKVRNAPVGAIYRFIVLTPQPGLTVDRLTGSVLATGDQSADELDRELTPNMTMHVLVRDMHNRLGRTVVRVHLSDVNDHTPLFIGQPYHAVFCLSSAISTDRSRPDTELPCRQNHFQVVAVDKDYGANGSIAYSLTSIRPRADPPLLTIDAKTGQLTLLRLIPPDWTGRQMDAVVLATDGGGLSASATITIHLVSQDGPRFSASHYTASVSESAPIGEAVTTVEASSPNPAVSLIYRMISVRMRNSSAGADVPAWMSVEVTDSPFMLEFNTGILRLVSSLDYEVTTGYLLLLEVLDTSSSLSARVYLSVNVTDVNDVAPQFAFPVYAAYVSERESVGYFVLQLSARDPDSGYGGQISYSLEPHLPENMSPDNPSLQFVGRSKEVLSYFYCDEHTGLITLARTLDYDILPTLRFWAVATDQAAEPLNSRVPVTVHVLDYNDHAPQLDSPSSSDSVGGSCLYKAKLNEHAPPGTVVLRLLASDPDVNDTLRYKLLPSDGGHSDHFRLSPTDGVLRWVPIRTSDGKVAVPPRDSAIAHSSVKDPSGFRIGVDAIPESMFGILQLQHEIWNVSEAATHLGQIRFATDPDRGKFGKLTYVLFGGHGREQFRLDSFSGDLYALEPLDRESVDHYELIIRVSDGGGLFDYMLLELYIQDVNDNRPQMVQLIYEFVLFPDEYNPQLVRFPFRTALYLQATDTDQGPNAQLIYRRFQPPESLSQTEFEQLTHVVDVDPRSGELLILAALMNSSITTDDELQFFVESCDSPVGGLSNMLCSSPARVVIHLAARALEFRPRIACTSTPVLEDDHRLDRDVASCQVQPSNLTGTWSLTYVLLESSISAPAFRIDSHSGHVYTTRPMDYEHGRSYRLGVEFHIANMKPNVAAAAARTELQINLVDVNDCVPELDAPVYVVKVPENVPVGTRLTGVSAQDKDVSGRDPITLSLWPVVSSLEWELGIRYGPDAPAELPLRLHNAPHANLELNLIRKQFMVDSDGWIVLKTPLDFETVREHKFKVAAVDSVGHWNSSLVIISVMDVNDNAPHWPLKESPDDSLDHFIFPDVLHRQLLHTEVTIPENWSPTVNSVIYQINVVDPDVEVHSRPFFYMLSEENVSLQANAKPSTYFSVSPSGAVQLRKALDRELAASYTLRFRASDGIFVTKDAFVLQVNVKDVNDNAPFCLEPQRHLMFPEDTPQGTVIAKLLAIDNDAEPIHSNVSYRLKSGDYRLFAVDSTTGLVRLQGALDFESERLHRFSVEASDNGGLNCLFHRTVQVVDVNDNAPEFEPVFINPIPEDVPIGSLVGKITARDRDVCDANRLVYSLQSAHDASFSIEPHTGLLKVSRTLDRETKSVHNLTVIVTDGLRTSFGGITSQTAVQFTVTTTFTVRLLDVNDSPPQFVNSSAHKLHVSELAPAGRQMTRLKAVSLDEGENAVVRYKLLTKQPEFSLNETTGDLRLEGALDHERVSSYFLTVEARDHGTPPLSTTAVITVNVEDENDNQPQFVGRQPIPITLLVENGGISLTDELKGLLSSFYSFTVAENSRNGTVVGRLKAVDADSGEHGRLTYRLSSTNSSIWMQYIHRSLSSNYELLDLNEARSRFHLDVNTGQLSLLFEPDREAVDEFWFSASVDDHGVPSAFTSHTLVRVRILDVNDCSPLFEKSAYEFTVQVDRTGNVSGCFEVQPLSSTTTEVGCRSAVGGRVLIGRLKLTDADANPNAGPFTCQLIHSGSTQSSSDSSRAAGGIFFVRNASSDPNDNNRTSANSNPNVGECLLYAVDRLPVGSQSLVLRANDNGLTALHTSVTVTVRVIRQANLPPEIVRGNATLTYYRGSYAVSDPTSVPSDDLSANLVVARVTIKDRTAHDRLTFELLPDSPGSTLFRVDRYDGTVRSASSAARSDAQSTASTDNPIRGQFNGYRHPVYPILSTPLSRLDSGLYPLRIRVSNGSLSSEETLFIQVVTITDEMLESAAIVRISNLLPNLFYMESYDRRLRLHLASCLLTDMRHFLSSGHSLNDHVHILSVQEADIVLTGSPSSVSLHRVPRSLDRAVDVLVAVYNPEQREFIKPHLIAEAVNQISDTLSSEFGGKVSVIYDVCTPQFCPRGRCYTRVTIDPHGLMNRVEVHRVSQVSPRFTLSPACRCPRHFTGLRCDTPLDGCSLAASCPTPRICVPQGPDSSVCVCPPPRTGPNCESVQPVGPHANACYSERCFLDREHGPLQFTGGSFIHWELVHCNSYHWEFTFAVRTRQPIGPLATIRWNALRAFQLRLATGGRLVVSALGISDGLPSADWLVSADPLSDGHWHRVRLVLAATSANHLDNVHNLLFRPLEDGGSSKPVTVVSDRDWWVELTVDGIHPRSTSIDWAPGDPVRQGLFLGSDPVHGFWPLTQQLPLSSAPVLGHAQQAEYNSDNTTLEESIVLRSGIVGCFRDIRVNQIKPPYQINHQAVLTRLRAEYASSSPGSTNLVLMRVHQLHYGCDPTSTVAGPCATGPCLHGGICAPGQLPAHQQQSSSGGSYACHCPPLFHGHHCERTSDACLLKPCQNGGSCQALFNSNTAKMPTNSGLAAYRCVCPAGVSGLHCELLHDTSSLSGSALSLHSPTEKNKGLGCRSARLVLQHTSPAFSLNTRQSIAHARWSAITRTSSTPQVVCLNGGVCLESASGPHCSCPLGWEGARCEHDINECQLADTFFARRGADRFTDSTRTKWMELHVPGSGGLCSPYEMGRGVCVNSPGSYQCNCSLGFGGRHCQNKNLVPLTPDPNALGLTQLHVYIIVGLLAFLFLAALTTIVILACRARGFIGAALEVDGTSKSVGSYVWPPGGKSQQQQRHSHQQASQKPSTHSLDQQFYRYNHSGGSSLAGVPFLSSSSGLPMHSNQLGMHSSCHGFPTVRMANRRPSLASSTFAMPLHANDDSGAALLTGQTESVQHASSSSAAPTMTDYMDQEDCSATGASRLLLYPTGGGDPVPVMMMMSPAMPYAGSVGNRTSLLPRHSPATSAIYYGSGNFSGTGTPTNHGSSSYIGYNIDPPGSVCIPPRHLHSASHRVAFYPAGAPHAYLAQHQTQRQLPQLVTVRPGSAVGSDRLSLGSGSDRFSAHSSQLLVPSNPSNGPHLTGPYGSHAYPHYQVVPTSAQQPSRPHTSQDLNPYGSGHPGSPSDETTRTLRPDNTDTLRPSLYFNGGTEEHEGSERPVGITHTHPDYYKPRPLPAKLQHIPQSVAQPMNPSKLSNPDLAIHSNGDVNSFSVLDGEATPTLHKAKELKSPTAPIVDDLSLNEMRQLSTISPTQAQDSSAFRPHSGVGKQFCNCNQPDPYSRTNELMQNGPSHPSTGVVVQEAADSQHVSPRSLDCHAPAAAAEPVHNGSETDYKPGTTCVPQPVNSDSRDLNGFAST